MVWSPPSCSLIVSGQRVNASTLAATHGPLVLSVFQNREAAVLPPAQLLAISANALNDRT